MIYTLNGLRRAIELNAIPVFDFSGKNTIYLYDAHHGNQVWEYFFESISPYNIEQINSWLKAGKIKDESVIKLTEKEFGYMHHFDPNRLATFWAWDVPVNKKAWMLEKRELGREYIKKYVKPRPHITTKVEEFCAANFNQKMVFGLHIRGTDFNYATPIPLQTYILHLDEVISQSTSTNYQIFVATDQQQYLHALRDKYGNKIIARDVLRSSNHIVPVKNNRVGGYIKGEEALIDMLLLSRCHHVIKGPAALGEMSLWFTDHNRITDLSLHCEFKTQNYSKLNSSFSELNIGNLSRFKLIKLRCKETLVKWLYSWKLVAFFYKRFTRVRQWLEH